MNEGSGVNSCFQTPQLFANLNSQTNTVEGFTSSTSKPTSILSQGLNNINSLFLKDNNKNNTKEHFSNSMVLNEDTRYLPIMFRNAPGNQDQLIDVKSNEHIKLEDESAQPCRNCKVAVCEDDYCRWQNKLFI